jgi:hypothetical protein
MPPHVFAALNEKLIKEKEETQEAIRNARKSMPQTIDYQEKLYRFTDTLNALLDPNADAAKKNKLLKDCIDRIEYKREAPQRTKSQKIRYYDKEKKRTREKSILNPGAHWTNPPIEIDVKLKV